MVRFPGKSDSFCAPSDFAAVGLSPDSLHALTCEVMRARRKFPSNRHASAALAEEVGEVATAFLEKEGRDRIREEALQVACVAMRIYEEGDSDYHDDFKSTGPHDRKAVDDEFRRLAAEPK